MKNDSFEAMVAMKRSGHTDRDANGNDISYLNYLKKRRRECKAKGLDFDANSEKEWFDKQWKEVGND